MTERKDAGSNRVTFKSKKLAVTTFHSGAQHAEIFMYPSSIRLIAPLPKREIVSSARNIASGEGYDLSKQGSEFDWISQFKSDGFPMVRLLSTILNDREPLPEYQTACAVLADDLDRFTPDVSLLRDEALLKEWMYRFTLGIYAHSQIGLGLRINKDLAETDIGRYYRETEAQIDTLRETLSSVGIDDLSAYIRFHDMFTFHGTQSMFGISVEEVSEKQYLEKGFAIDKEQRAIISGISSVKKENDLLGNSVLDENSRTWEKLRVGWGSRQIREILSLLPKIKSPAVIKHVIFALEENLFDFSERPLSDERGEMKIDPEGVVELLKWKYELTGSREDDFFSTKYPHVVLESEKNLEFENFSVPKRHLPHPAILLLKESRKRSNKEEFEKLLKNIDELAASENITVPWFITLLIQRATDPEMSDYIESMISGLTAIPERIKEIFLNREVGKLWLTKEGKLRTSNNQTLLLSAFPIYTSSKEPKAILIQDQENPAKVKEESIKPEPKIIPVDSTIHVPLFGEVGITKDGFETRGVISNLFEKKQSSLDEGNLLDEFGKLSDEWIMADSDRGRDLLYIARLNASDSKLSEASDHGVEAVFVKGEETVLIVRKDLALADCSSKSIPLGLRGKIDGFGQLRIVGMDESFVGEREQLFLNNLVLHLALQPMLYGSGIPEEQDKELIREMNRSTSSWNRSASRGSLPKIDRIADRRNLPIRIPGYLNPVLVGERLS